MNNGSLAKRSFNLDVLRILALVFIPCLHWFLYIGFYDKSLDEPIMYVSYFIRNLFLLGLPLFMLLTGYLQGNKKISISKSYFIKITKFLVPYIIITAVYLLVDAVCLKSEYTPQKLTETFTSFINYSWYVEMYVGLFLLIPFLNLIYGCLKDKKQEITLICILISLSLLPSLINSFAFGSQNPLDSSNTERWSLIPDWWHNLYPITYYFTGAYLKKHKDEFRLKSSHLLILFFISLVVTNAYHFARDIGNQPSIHGWLYWRSITLYIPAVFLFMFIVSLDFGNPPTGLRKAAAKLSDLCFGALIASKIADMVIYPIVNDRLSVKAKAIAAPVIILIILAISFLISLFADSTYKLLFKAIAKIKDRTKQQSRQ